MHLSTQHVLTWAKSRLMSFHVVKRVSAWKMTFEENRNIEGAARLTRKIVGGDERKFPEKIIISGTT